MAQPQRVLVAHDGLGVRGRLPGTGRASEQALIRNSEPRVVEDILHHPSLFGVTPTLMPQIDGHLADLLATEV